MGTTNPTQKLDVNGKIVMRNQTKDTDSDNTVATKGYVDSNGVYEESHYATSNSGGRTANLNVSCKKDGY